jgi:hypothetical protein
MPGHVVGAGQSSGIAEFEGSELASLAISFTIDFINGSGTRVLYTARNFEDGSLFGTLGRGTTRASQDGKTASFDGSITFLQGSGGFAGIEGGGTYTSKRLALFGKQAQTYLDITATYRLPNSGLTKDWFLASLQVAPIRLLPLRRPR